MPYEVDFLPVGEGQKSGDAIAFRFAYPNPANDGWVIVVVDGGYMENGESLVKHINDYYLTNRVDIVISSHPDADHVNGLEAVLDRMEVGELWMHLPWAHTEDIAKMFVDGRVTDNGVTEKLKRSLQGAHDLEAIAQRRGIPVVEPFTGVERFGGSIRVVGPDLDYYESLVHQFRSLSVMKAVEAILSRMAASVTEAVKALLRETLEHETLTDFGETSAENNSSVVLHLDIDGERLLLTADAGIPALTRAADVMDGLGLSLRPLAFMQVPHHGSKRNVGPTVLNRLLGPPRTQTSGGSAFVSAAMASEKHPARKVTNAFIRRGAVVVATKGTSICKPNGMTARPGWGPVDPVPFYEEVEDE